MLLSRFTPRFFSSQHLIANTYMKILYISKALPFSYKGGIQTHVWELSKWMIRQGHDVSILTAGGLKKGFVQKEIEGRTIFEIPYLPGRYIPVYSLFLEDYFFNRAVLRWLRKHNRDYDIIHIQGRSGCLYPKRKRPTDTPCVSTFHGTSQGEYEAAKGSSIQQKKYLHQKYMTPFELEVLKYSDQVVAVSNEMKSRMLREYGPTSERAKIIYNGIDSEGYEENRTEQDPNLLLFVGRIAAVKGLYSLVDAMVKVAQPVTLVLIGAGPDQPALEDQIEQLGLTERIKFIGTKDTHEVQQWLYKSFALVLPSFHESQGIVLMEANVCERPVVASNIPGIDEVVTDGVNGLLFEAGDIEQIAGTINKLFSMPKEAAEMGKRGRDIVLEKFSWERIALETKELYQKLLENTNEETISH